VDRTDSHSEDDEDNALGRGGDGDDDGDGSSSDGDGESYEEQEVVMEDDTAGTAAATGAMRIPSKSKQTGTTPEVDQHHHRRDVIHLRKQQWRWELPFYSS
jgi:hypothetical protein